MAAGAKAKAKGSANSAVPKGKPAKAPRSSPSPTASGKVTPLVKDAFEDAVDKAADIFRIGRPDRTSYDADQKALNAKIAELREKMATVYAEIDASSNRGSGNKRQIELRAELNKIGQDQEKFKNSRGQIVGQLKAINGDIAKKIKDWQAAKSKTQFKSVAEVDAHIKQVEGQVKSGSTKLVEEISQCERLRKTVEGLQVDQESIERDRAAASELHKQLDDLEAEAVSERADGIKAELDQLRKDSDQTHATRKKLFEQRNEFKAQMDELYNQKRECALDFRKRNDIHQAKVSEDCARRAKRVRVELDKLCKDSGRTYATRNDVKTQMDKLHNRTHERALDFRKGNDIYQAKVSEDRAQRQVDEEAKKKETALRLHEEAETPAYHWYQVQVEDCQTLIDYFSGKSGGTNQLSTSSEPLVVRGEVAGVHKLEPRQVDKDVAGFVVRKKKGDDDEAYFVGGKSKKGKKSGAKATPANGDAAASASSGPLNIPLPTLSALLALSIPAPASPADVPRTIEYLKIKKAWFEANLARVAAENIAKAEASIRKFMSDAKAVVSPNGDGEKPPEPISTPAVPGILAQGIPSSEVDQQLEAEVWWTGWLSSST
ncbi:hypothetical protein M0805_007598 [Coniferiporia weirii]|nr:hypothetical protein M0805_007598 [Coniferiporia weirii]